MCEQASDVRPSELREPGVPGLVRHQRRPFHPQGLVRVHPRAVVAEERLRHEGHALPVLAGDVLDHVLVGHDLVGHARQRGEAEIDLALPARGDLVVVELARDPEALERQHHLRAEVVERVRRSRGEVALLRPCGVAEARLAGIPVALRRVDVVVRGVGPEVVVHLVEDEELALGAEVRGVGDPARAQVRLRAPRDPARVLRIGRARDRVGDLADEGQRGRLGRGIEDRRGRIGHEEHVGVLNRLPAADRGAVEAQALVERGLVEAAHGKGHVLPRPEQVAELEVDHRRARLAGPLERLTCVRQRLAAVHQVVPGLDFRHLASSARWTTKKDPRTPLSPEATSPRPGASPRPT
jgi:hypothetical protein